MKVMPYFDIYSFIHQLKKKFISKTVYRIILNNFASHHSLHMNTSFSLIDQEFFYHQKELSLILVVVFSLVDYIYIYI